MFSSLWSLTGSPFNWLRRHQSKAVSAFIVLSINPDRHIQNMFGRSGLCFSLCNLSFIMLTESSSTLFLHRRVNLNSVVFFSHVFSLLIFDLWLSWWRLSSFEGVLLRLLAQICPVCANLLYVVVAVGYESSSQCLWRLQTPGRWSTTQTHRHALPVMLR